MANADELHSRRGTGPVLPKAIDTPVVKDAAVINEGTPIAIKISKKADQQPADFNDFYPLHVTKVEDKKGRGGVLWSVAIGIIIVLLVLAVTLWYLYINSANSSQNNSPSTSSQSPAIGVSSSPAPSASSTTTPTQPTTYANSQYGFSLTFPVSWQGVQEANVDLSSFSVKPIAAVAFNYPAPSTSTQSTMLMRIRIDSSQTYQQWQNSIDTATKQETKLLGQSSGYYISADYLASSQPSATQALQQAITDLTSVTSSFAPTSASASPSPAQ